MKRWHRALAAIVAGLLVTSVVGCGSSKTQEKNPAPAPAATPASGPVEIAFWGDWGGEGQKQFETMVDAFNKSQDKIKVKYVLQEDMITKFLTAATSGGSPDVLFWDRWRTALYAPKNVMLPIDDFMKADGVNRSDFYDEALKELSYNGKLYGLPLTVDARALFYNKKILAEKNLQPPKTWEELATVAKATTVWEGNKLVRAGFSLGDAGLFNMYLQQAGGSMLTADGAKTNFNNSKGLEVLAFWNRLMNEEKAYKLGFEQGLGEGNDAFVTGKVAMQ